MEGRRHSLVTWRFHDCFSFISSYVSHSLVCRVSVVRVLLSCLSLFVLMPTPTHELHLSSLEAVELIPETLAPTIAA